MLSNVISSIKWCPTSSLTLAEYLADGFKFHYPDHRLKNEDLGVIDAAELRDAILQQRQLVLDAEETGMVSVTSGGTAPILTEIRDIFARIEQRGSLRS